MNTLSLEVMTLNPRCESVETAQGVPLTVTGVAQVKVRHIACYFILLIRLMPINSKNAIALGYLFNYKSNIA